MFEFNPASFEVRSRSAIVKVDDNENRAFKLRARFERVIKRAYFDFVENATADDELAKVQELYKRGDLLGMMRLPLPHIKEFATVLQKVFIGVANAEMKALVDILDIEIVKVEISASVDITFNPGDAFAADFMRKAELDFIREISKAQRDVIRQAMSEAMEKGLSHIEASRLFKNSLPLTTYQENAVKNFRRLLETNVSEAQTRVLRDRRYDRSLNRAARTGTSLTPKQIDTMTARYRSRMVSMRAETIARTEGQRIMNVARYQAALQMLAKAGIPDSHVYRVWHTFIDGRERASHHAMNNQRRGIKEHFKTPAGIKLLYPGDRKAPAKEVINCRCLFTIHLKNEAKQPSTDQPIAQQSSLQTSRPRVSFIDQAQSAEFGTSLYVEHPSGLYYVPKDPNALSPSLRASGKQVTDFKTVVQSKKDAVFNALTRDAIHTALTRVEKKAIKEYTEDAYKFINKTIKSLRNDRAADEISFVSDIDTAFDKVSFPRDMTVYRAIENARFDKLAASLKKGETVILDKAYVSSTLDVEGVFGTTSSTKTIKILVPKGSRVMPVSEFTTFKDEYEVIIDRNSEFLVRYITKDAIVLELLPKVDVALL